MALMWSHLPVQHLQPADSLRAMGERARRLLAEGYAVDADRVLDEMIERGRRAR